MLGEALSFRVGCPVFPNRLRKVIFFWLRRLKRGNPAYD
uniref:Uncharacterized protein n=1 Tax=uncultured Desulfobacterium sp. TaxID=201089 RepID=E1YFR9_9BACT|nr:unknown protein [uncultured Desulfobacterium sp.]